MAIYVMVISVSRFLIFLNISYSFLKYFPSVHPFPLNFKFVTMLFKIFYDY